MYRLTLLTGLLCMPLMAGCTTWADSGQGGAAEDLPQLESSEPDQVVSENTRELLQDFNLSQRHLDVLILKGAQRCFPASVHTARLRQNKVAREIAGGLVSDAETSLVDLRLDLQRLQRKLEAIANSDSCWADEPQARPVAMQKESVNPSSSAVVAAPMQIEFDSTGLLAQLNSDNQFALGSDQINPKYEDNLAMACVTLTQRPDIRLEVTGHADASGNSDHNAALSSRRAMSVAEFFVACGISPERIALAYEGDQDPQYSGRSPAIDLVNRRVSIEIDFGERQNSQ